MRLNKPIKMEPKFTHEGARASQTTALQDLRRSVMSCMLFEGSFYESGVEIVDRISSLVAKVRPSQVADLAIEARERGNLRHVPLLLLCQLAKNKALLASTVERVIQRPDELAEILAIYQKLNARTGTKKLNRLSKQLQKGLALAFRKFNEYSLAKYSRDAEIKLRDVLFLCHAKPKDAEQDRLWKRLIDGKLQTPDTWEVALSASKGEAKREIWERLLTENKLGALALLRNLRNMREASVNEKLVRKSLTNMKTERVLPFRFVAAARFAPQWEPELEEAMFRCLAEQPKLAGKTALVIDNSGSMYGAKVSAKSDMDRSDAACALAILVREICENVTVISYSTNPKIVPARRGFALRDAIQSATEHSSTYTDSALALAEKEGYDRIIVITDEQSHQSIRGPLVGSKAYFVNVAPYQNGVGYGPWTHVDGFSEAILDFIRFSEVEVKGE